MVLINHIINSTKSVAQSYDSVMQHTLTNVTKQYGSRHLKLVPSYDDCASAYLIEIYIHDRPFEQGTTHLGLLKGYASEDEALNAGSIAAIEYMDSL